MLYIHIAKLQMVIILYHLLIHISCLLTNLLPFSRHFLHINSNKYFVVL
nr:MAG TPA: hypothetical protein [Bacteriophage sp.]